MMNIIQTGATHRATRSLAVLLLLTLFVAVTGCKKADDKATQETPAMAEEHAADDHETDVDHDDHDGHGHDDHAGHDHEELPPTELPGTSVFHLPYTWTTTTGEDLKLADLRGKPTVLVMFYATCVTACPVLFSDAKKLEASLPDDVRKEVQFVFVTMDPERDTDTIRAAYASNLDLDMKRWHLLRGDDTSTRALSAVLGVQYRVNEDGHFNHTNRLSVADADGSIVLTVDGLNQPLDKATQKLTELVREAK